MSKDSFHGPDVSSFDFLMFYVLVIRSLLLTFFLVVWSDDSKIIFDPNDYPALNWESLINSTELNISWQNDLFLKVWNKTLNLNEKYC